MLTDKEQQRIRSEETFRHEVRRQLKKPESQTLPSKLKRFFNSPLGLWVLSSLVLTGLTTGYARLQAHFQARSAQEQQRRLAIEHLVAQLTVRIQYSLTLFHGGIKFPFTPPDVSPDLKRPMYCAALDAALDDSAETRLFPEFKEVSTYSLLLELEQLNPSLDTGPHQGDLMRGSLASLRESRKKLESDATYYKMSAEDQSKLLASIEDDMKGLASYLYEPVHQPQ
jgi:hypothetical protein